MPANAAASSHVMATTRNPSRTPTRTAAPAVARSSANPSPLVTTPATTKRGHIIPITKEAIFFDLTGRVLEQAGKVGQLLGIDKEKRCIDVLCGAVNNYSWKDTAYDTYRDTTPWINLLSGAGFDLVDWTDIDSAEQLFSDMLDPNTGEPIIMGGQTIIGAPARRHQLNRILNATEIRYTASSAPTETLATNPITGYSALTSRLLYHRQQANALALTAAQAAATWYVGDFREAFRYMENWPLTVVQAPPNSPDEFNRDIVTQYKASEMGVAAVNQPRAVVKVKGHA